jgi:hypothetical protein
VAVYNPRQEMITERICCYYMYVHVGRFFYVALSKLRSSESGSVAFVFVAAEFLRL